MRYKGANDINQTFEAGYDMSKSVNGLQKYTGLFIAKVIDTVDDRYEGFMRVEIVGENFAGTTESKDKRAKYHRIRRSSPYGGSYQYANATNSYGFSSHPPAPGSQILVAFPNNSDVGVMVGVLPDVTRNASVPSNAASFVDSEANVIGPTLDPSVKKPQTKNTRPRASGQTVKNSEEQSDKTKDGESLTNQGIGIDSLRGLSSSSQRRESPTQVFGFNTPGGHSFVMDDGTLSNSDTCLTPDKARKAGLSNLVRLQSQGGAQILMHDGTGMIYIINQSGSSWVQISNDGKIDIYAEDAVSMHTKTDFNLYCEGNFNLDADKITMKARGEGGATIETATGEFNLHSNKDIKLTTDLNGHIRAKGNMRTTAALIDLNGPEATEATKTVANNLTVNKAVKESINGRVPEAEPWGGHAEEQEILPQVASADTEFTAKDIDMSKINNNQSPNASAKAGKSNSSSVSPRKVGPQ